MNPLIAVLCAAAAAAALTSLLAALLVLAERLLVNYGTCTIDVNEGARRLEVQGGLSLLASLREEGIFVPSACGGRGTCAYCKIHVISGAGPVAPTEGPLLTDREIADGIRISCLVKVRNDLALAIPPELFLVKAYRGVVERIRLMTHDIKAVQIRLIEPETITFEAGQYVQLEAPAYGDNPDPVYRAYSLASPPVQNDRIELIIRLVPGGICTTWVFTLLQEGQQVSFSGPYGDFQITDSDREMIWIAGGTGMAPFWSMIRYLKENDIRRKCTYFFGVVQERDMFLLDELRQLEAELDWFTFVPALSAPPEDNHWPGQSGLITEVVDRHLGDGSEAEVYLCGSPAMIDAAADILRTKGVTDERIFFDKFL